jgi:hypothetical protein
MLEVVVSCHRKVKGFELSGRKSLCSKSMSMFAQDIHSCRTMHAYHRIPHPFIGLLYVGSEPGKKFAL